MRELALEGETPAIDEILGLELEIAEHHEAELRRRSLEGEPPSALLQETLAELRALTRAMRGMRKEIRNRSEQLRRLDFDVKRERQRYRELLRTSPVAFVMTDITGVIRDANLAAESLFGRTKEHLVDKSITDFLPRGDVGPFEAQMHAALAAAEARTQWETNLGSELALAEPIGITMTLARDPNGRVDHLRWCIVRLGERRRAERSERAYLREKTARTEAERLASRFRCISMIESALSRLPAAAADAIGEVLVPAFADRCTLLDIEDFERAFGPSFVPMLSGRRALFVPSVDARCLPDTSPPAEPECGANAFAIFAPVLVPQAPPVIFIMLGRGERHPFGPDDVLLVEIIASRLVVHAAAPALSKPFLPHR